MPDEKLYWPFETADAPYQIPLEPAEFGFLEQAHREGFSPHKLPISNYGASSPAGRVAYIIVRGRVRREVWLGADDEKVGSLYVDSFDAAADAALRWLRGDAFASVGDAVREHIVVMPGAMRPGP